jgi:hypothetical protein
MRTHTVVAMLLLAISSATGTAAPGDCAWLEVNKRGFRPHAVITYTVEPSPDGRPYPARRIRCVDRAFEAWTRANARSGLGIRFVRGTGDVAGDVAVRFDKRGGLLLTANQAGGWNGEVRSPDGYLEQANIWVTSDSRLVDGCHGVTTVILHELGHLHGLADTYVHPGMTVMNPVRRRDDGAGSIPDGPTRCDATRAARAASVEPMTQLALQGARR